MNKKEVEQEQLKLTKEIQQKENKAHELNHEKKRVNETFDTFQLELRKGYRELTRLNQEVIHFGGKETLAAQQQEDEEHLIIRRRLGILQEEIIQQYGKEAKLIELEK